MDDKQTKDDEQPEDQAAGLDAFAKQLAGANMPRGEFGEALALLRGTRQ